MTSLTLKCTDMMKCPHCNEPQEHIAGKYTEDDGKHVCTSCQNEYYCIANDFGGVYVTNEPITESNLRAGQSNTIGFGSNPIPKQKPTKSFTKKALALVLTGIFLSALQPWESPEEKIRDEFKVCTRLHEKKCRYAGTVFHTNRIEMGVSELIHGHINLCRLRTPKNKC